MSTFCKSFCKSVIFFVILFTFFRFTHPVEAAVLSLNPSSSTVTLGDEFDVLVRIDTEGERVTSADVQLVYDRTRLQVISVTNGRSGTSAFFPDFFQNLSSNQIYMGGSVINPTDTRIGQGNFSTVRFKSLTNGAATVGFICQNGSTTDTNISRADKNATDIVSCSRISNVYYMVDPNPVSIHSIQIQAQMMTMKVGDKPIGLSALAYDQNSLPIWSGVTYEWGVSSGSSIGSVSPVFGTISNFMPLHSGIGDIYVIARMGTQMQASGVQMTVIEDKAGDLNNDGRITLSDLSTLLSNFGKSNRSKAQGDTNGDGSVTLADLSTLLSNFGK